MMEVCKNILGKGEAESSNLSSSTIHPIIPFNILHFCFRNVFAQAVRGEADVREWFTLTKNAVAAFKRWSKIW
ncbi:MAG TPA: hypothetical protein DDW73_12330 [Rhizobium sp.]|nr:hypothetical protein [Rhizobium sp.]